MHLFEFIRTLTCSPTNPPKHLDLGVVIIARIILSGLLVAALGLWFPAIGEFLLPRFGAIGLILGGNCLIFLYQWAKMPTRSYLLTATTMTAFVGLGNAYILLKVGTVDVVENVFSDRIHSAWIWSVVPYLGAAAYMAIVAFRMPKDSLKPA